MGLVQKSFSDIITFSRSSNATRVGPTGVLEYAPHNLVLQSQTFDNASWTKSAASVVANSATAPDGTVTADILIPSASAGIAPATYQNITVGLVTHTWSVYAKAAGYSWLMIKAQDATAGTCPTWFNLATGAIGSTTAGNTNNIISVGNGWYRCSVTRVVSNATAYMNLQVADADGAATMTGNGTSGIYLWGAQLAVGPYALDYTPTTSAAVYGPRFDYDPVTLAARGLLVEEQRTNVVQYSEQFDNAYWTKNDLNITVDAVTAPDGTVTAEKVIPNTSTVGHAVLKSLISGTSGAHTASIFAKAAGYDYIGLSDATTGQAVFNLQTGAIVSQDAGITASTPVSIGNGWWRVQIAFTPSGTARGLGVDVWNNATKTIFAGDGTSGVYLWGAQLEAGSFATSYIPTVASTVTRSADVASVNTLSPWFNATEGTLFIDSSSSATAYSAALYTSISSYIATVNGPSGSAFEVVAGSPQAAIGTQGLSTKVAGAYKANDFAVSTNGGTVATDTSGTVPNITDRLQIGSFPAVGFYVNGYIRRIAYFPRRLLDAELQALTA